jgi:hypothetical protein
MNVDNRTKAAQFLFWEYLFRIFGIMSLQCVMFYYSPKLLLTQLKQDAMGKLNIRAVSSSYFMYIIIYIKSKAHSALTQATIGRI